MLRYREIKLEIKDIVSEMNNGDKLPSRVVLSKRLDASRATIEKAIRELTEEGILESKFGSGTYVARRLEGVVQNVRNWCLIVPNITLSVYIKLIHSVTDAAREFNTNVILCNSEESVQKQSEYINRMLMAGIDGFILVPVVTKNVIDSVEPYQTLMNSKIPFVFCNRDVEGVSVPIVKSNDFFGSYSATQHLIENGYRNIAFLSRWRYRTSIERFHGYNSALQQSGLEIARKRILMLEEATPEACYDSLTALIKSGTPVDAVFCFNDEIAFHAVKAIDDLHLRISDDIGVIGYDGSPENETLRIPLTTVSYESEEIGRLAAQVLEKMIERKEQDPFSYYLVNPRIVPGKSCLGKK